MATATIGTPAVDPTGLGLRVPFLFVTDPASSSIPDWQAAWSAAKRLTFNGTDLGPPAGIESVDFTDWMLVAKGNGAGSAIGVGASVATPKRYFYRLVITETATGNKRVSSLGGRWDSTNGPLTFTAAQSGITFYFDAIPTGSTAEIFFSAVDDNNYANMAASLRLLKSGIAAGATSHIETTFVFDGPSTSPPTKRSWVGFWILPDELRVAYEDADPTISGPIGLIADSFGNTTAAFTNVSVTNRSDVDSDGNLSTLFASYSGKVRYVSETQGNPTTGTGTFNNPYTTPDAALADYSQKEGGVIYLLRGETQATRTTKLFAASGSIKAGVDNDRTRPLIIRDYWNDAYGSDPGTRPVMVFKNSDVFNILSSGGTGLANWQNVVWARIGFKLVVSDDGTYPNLGRLRIAGSFKDLRFHDCVFDNCQPGFDMDTERLSERATFNRCIFIDQRITGVLDTNPNSPPNTYIAAHRQGLHTFGVCNCTVAQCTFDYCGWWYNPTTATWYSDDENHATYFQNKSESTYCWGNVFSRISSDGIKIRGGGVAAWNFGVRCGLFINNGRNSSWYSNNWCEAAESQGLGYIWSNNTTFWHEGPINVMEFCGATKAAVAVNRAIDPFCWDGTANRRRKYGLVRHMTVAQHNSAVKTGGSGTGPPTGSVTFTRNLFLGEGTGTRAIYWQVTTGTASDFTGLEFSQNYVYGSESVIEEWRVGSTTVNSPSVIQGTYGLEDESIFASVRPTFTNEAYTIANASAALGGPATEALWRDAIRTRLPGVFPAYCDGRKIVPKFQAAYEPTNIVPINVSADFGHFGVTDYRPVDIDLTYTLEGPSGGVVGAPLTFVTYPSNLSGDTVTYESSLAGSFDPTGHTFSDDAVPTEFNFTPSETGTGATVTVVRTAGGTPGTVASSALTITAGPGKSPFAFGGFGHKIGA